MRIKVKARVVDCEQDNAIGLVRRTQYRVTLDRDDGYQTTVESSRPVPKHSEAEITVRFLPKRQ